MTHILVVIDPSNGGPRRNGDLCRYESVVLNMYRCGSLIRMRGQAQLRGNRECGEQTTKGPRKYGCGHSDTLPEG